VSIRNVPQRNVPYVHRYEYVKNRTEFYSLRSIRKTKRALSSLRYVKLLTYHFGKT